jgi:hypothetical protein
LEAPPGLTLDRILLAHLDMSQRFTAAPQRVAHPPPLTNELDPVEEAVADIKAGKFVVVVDDMDRENEGDLIMAGSEISTEQMAWLIRHSS